MNVCWLLEPRAFEDLLRLVGEDRREKALALRLAQDRALSLGAGLLLNFALAREGRPWPPRVRLGRYGKPALTGPDAPRFNLSHAGEYAVCAIGCAEVGVDIERIGPADASVARRCFTPAELKRVMPDEARVDAAAFCLLWAMKESFIKRIGTGLTLDPLDVEVLDGRPPRVRGQAARACGFWRYGALPGYELALCASDGHFPERVDIVGPAALLTALT